MAPTYSDSVISNHSPAEIILAVRRLFDLRAMPPSSRWQPQGAFADLKRTGNDTFEIAILRNRCAFVAKGKITMTGHSQSRIDIAVAPTFPSKASLAIGTVLLALGAILGIAKGFFAAPVFWMAMIPYMWILYHHGEERAVAAAREILTKLENLP